MEMNNITASEIMEAVNRVYDDTHLCQWNGVDIIVKHTLTLADVFTFVSTVVKTCFSESGEYMPEVKDFAIKNMIIEMYTNIETPDDTQEKHDLVYHSGMVECVTGFINNVQFNEMYAAINEKIQHIARHNIEATNLHMNEVLNAMENLQGQVSRMFESVNADDVAKLMSAVSDGGLDEAKIVNAFMDSIKK